MGAVVEKDEDADEDCGRRHRERERDAVAIPGFYREDHQGIDGCIQDERGQELPDGYAGIGLGILGKRLVPRRFFHMRGDQDRIENHAEPPLGRAGFATLQK